MDLFSFCECCQDLSRRATAISLQENAVACSGDMDFAEAAMRCVLDSEKELDGMFCKESVGEKTTSECSLPESIEAIMRTVFLDWRTGRFAVESSAVVICCASVFWLVFFTSD